MKSLRAPYFLNVDLDIESTVPLRSLIREFGKRASIMYSGHMNGRYCLFFEIAAMHKTAEKTIHALSALIESLSPKGRQLWDAAKRKEFDIGFDARFSSYRVNRFSIDTKTLRRVSDLGASIAVTLYKEERQICRPRKNGKRGDPNAQKAPRK
jgi:hypothetical protein